jgi:Flp pilus assembly protein protease CpaA
MDRFLLLAPWLGSVTVAAIAAVTDLRSGQIPNRLTYPALVVGPLWHAATFGRAGLLTALLGIVAAGLGPALLYNRGVMGGGDVKLFAALGGLIGGHAALAVQWLALALVTGYALGAAAWRGQLRATLCVIFGRLRRGGAGAVTALPEGVPSETRLGGAILLACLIVGFGGAGGVPP